MNPEDDPEARIRELEQPLAEAARASELGDGGGYSYPPPPPGPVPPPAAMPAPGTPPPYGYGSAYAVGARKSSGFRWFWVLAAVGILGLLVLVGGIAAYAARQFSHGDAALNAPPASGSATTAPKNPGPTTPGGKTDATGPGPSPTPGPVVVSGINENRTIACDGNTVTVSGISNTVTLTGHCASVAVSGLQNVVTIDTTDSIDASGLNNKVTFRSGAPKISNSGSGNVVEPG
ncbi:DUF3060 domain-containing protein [Mycobacterium vicinigordonae]|uniref:DUF3060 domain-containing protein n=1 Tax=Mycobacterium vicinigordonae TaxID=1719132 RepID=A0A7D6I6B4_9MYCO|nr:DUF3060 domain-containing protein [Mycobacterium vicinigordonae]QLL07998.1 DUF3060 domain-containing protein [Mycobacterium vicinigordonae]